nr:MFS transporter [Nocardioides panaciterrulae]
MSVSTSPASVGGAEYRKLLAGSAVSNLGDGISFIAIPLLAATLTSSPELVAGLSFAYSLPRLVMSSFSGVIADRVDRRRLMVVVNAARGLMLFALVASVVSDSSSIWMLYAVYGALGLLETLADTSAFTVLPSIVRPEELARANGRLATAQTLFDEIAGPPLGGLLFGVAVAVPIAADATSFVVAALLFSWLRGRFQPDRERATTATTLRHDLGEGLRYLFGNPTLLSLAASGFLSTLAYMAPFSVLVLFATKTVGLTATEYGIALTISALGSLIGSVVAERLDARLGSATAMRVMLVLGAAAFAVLAISTSAVLVTAMLAVYFLHTTVWSICFASWRQRLIPNELLGRVGGAMRTFNLLGLVLGSVAGGLIAGRIGLQAPFWFGAATLVVAAVLPLGERAVRDTDGQSGRVLA